MGRPVGARLSGGQDDFSVLHPRSGHPRHEQEVPEGDGERSSNCFLAALAGLAPLVFARTTDRIFGFPAHVIPLAFLGLLRQEKTE